MASRKTIADLKAWAAEHMPGYECLGTEYVNNKTPVPFRHVQCGTVWDARPDMLTRGRRCPTCNGTKRKTTEEYQKDLDEKFGEGEYAVQGQYVDNKTPVDLLHVQCGKVWSPLPRDVLVASRVNGCFHCNGTPAVTHTQFLQEVRDRVGDEYAVLGQYTDRATKVLMRHAKCGHEWAVRPGNFLRPYGDRCPACNLGHLTSRGSRMIADLLTKAGIAYESEKTFEGCRSRRGKLMPFDFYVEELHMAIEYDGPQHTYAMSDRGGQEGFRIRQENDDDKDRFCADNDIILLRLSYFRESYIPTDLAQGLYNARSIRQTHHP
jgi:uncharacterized protein with PIN domain